MGLHSYASPSWLSPEHQSFPLCPTHDDCALLHLKPVLLLQYKSAEGRTQKEGEMS